MPGLRKIVGMLLVALALVGSAWPQASVAPPVTLPDAVATALEHNPALQATQEENSVARARLGLARSSWYPRIDFSQSFTRGDNPVYVFGTLLTQRQFSAPDFALNRLNTPTPLDNFQTRFDGQFSLFDFGRTWFRVGAAKHMKSAAEFQTEQARQDLLLRVLRAYYGVLVAREDLEAAGEAVRSAESNQQQVENRVKAGTAVDSDLLSARVFSGQMKEREIRAQNELEIARMALGHELGLGPDSPRDSAGVLTEPAPSPAAMEEYEGAALATRPALKAAEFQRAAAGNQRKEAAAELLPHLNVFAGFERDAERLGGPAGSNWTAGTRLDINVFGGGADRDRLAEAQARERQSEDQLAWFRSGVKLEVRKAYLETTAAQQRAQVARDSVGQAAESLRIVQNRYQAGMTTITELLRAQTANLDARTAYLAALHDWQVARAELERAAGRLTADSPIIRTGGTP